MPQWWEQDEVVAPAQGGAPGIIRGAPKPVDPLAVAAGERAERSDVRAAASDDRAAQSAMRAQLEWDATHNPDGSAKKADNADGNPLPAWAATPYEKQIGVFGEIKGGLNQFQDEYAGNTLTGGLENSLQAKGLDFGMASPGQRDWWARFGSTDNVIRNDLFGAALTDSEKAAYAATTVDPSMTAGIVKENLGRRRDILSKALARKTNFLKAQGYSKAAIEALAGEYAQELGAAVVAPDAPPAPLGDKPVLPAAPPPTGAPPASGVAPPPAAPQGTASFDANNLVVDAGGGQPVLNREDREFISGNARNMTPQQMQQWFATKGLQITPEEATQAADYYSQGGSQDVYVNTPQSEGSALGAAAATPLGSYGIGAANALTGGTLDEIVGAFGGDAQGAQLAKEAAAVRNPGASLAGEVGGGVLAALGAGGLAGRLAPGANAALRGLGADTAYGALYGAGDDNENRLRGAATGGLFAAGGSVAGSKLASGLSRALAPIVDPAVQRLKDAGVTMTAGQLAGTGGGRVGQFIKGVEDRIAGLPVIGEAVNSGRRQGVEQLNRSAINEALTPIGGGLPDSVKTGQDAIAWGQQRLSDAYDDALVSLNAPIDPQLQTGLQGISASAAGLPQAQRETLKSIIARDVAPFTNGSGNLTGEQLQAIKRGLDKRIASAGRGSPADELLADTLSDVRDEFLSFAQRADPAQAAKYRAADDAYANFVVLERAAANAKEGIFSPAQFRTAVRQSDRSVRKRATAAGRARMQGLADAASEVLPSSVPDSGTAGRLVIPALALGGGAGLGYASEGGATGAITGAALGSMLYSNAGRRGLQALVTGRPAASVKAGEALRLPGVLRGAGIAGTGLGVGLE